MAAIQLDGKSILNRFRRFAGYVYGYVALAGYVSRGLIEVRIEPTLPSGPAARRA